MRESYGSGLPRAGTPIGESLTVVGPIGGGELGVVFLCDDEALGRRVALKILRPDRASPPSRVAVFLETARSAANVTSANVATIYDVGMHQSLPYVVMEHVPGVGLDEHRQDHGGRLKPMAALAIMDGMLRGLTALHARGLAHGAIGSSNVLVAPDGRVVLTDAGMANTALGSLDPVAASSVRFRGPRADVTRATLEDAFASDVVAAMALTYELLTGSPPRLDPRHGISPPSMVAVVPPTLDDLVVEILTNGRSAMLDPERLRSAIEGIARSLHGGIEPLRVMLIDVDDESARAMQESLVAALAPVVVLRETTGEGALDRVATESVAFVVLDPNVPDMSGLELVAALREQRRMRDTPILIVSERAGANDWRLLQSLGARAFVMKPAGRAVIGALATELARGRRARPRPSSMFP